MTMMMMMMTMMTIMGKMVMAMVMVMVKMHLPILFEAIFWKHLQAFHCENNFCLFTSSLFWNVIFTIITCTTSLCGIIFIFIVKKFKKILHLSKTLPCPKPNSPSRMTSWDFEKGPRKLQILAAFADFFKFKASPLLLTRPTPAKDSLHFIPTKKRLEKLPPLILPPSQGL